MDFKIDSFQTESSQWYEEGFKIREEMVIAYSDDRHEQRYKEGTPVHYKTFLSENPELTQICSWIKHYFNIQE